MPLILSGPLTLLAAIVVAVIAARTLDTYPALRSRPGFLGRAPRLQRTVAHWLPVLGCALTGEIVLGFVSRDIVGAPHATVRVAAVAGLALGGVVGFLGRNGDEPAATPPSRQPGADPPVAAREGN